MWATKKQLRRDAERLKAENEALIRELKTELSIAQTNAEEVPKLLTTVEKLKKQIATKNDTIRKQTEADLLVNALQALGIIPKPPSGENFDHFAKASELQDRLENSNLAFQQQQAFESQNAVSGLGAALFGQTRSF